jgi:hypothetical protein
VLLLSPSGIMVVLTASKHDITRTWITFCIHWRVCSSTFHVYTCRTKEKLQVTIDETKS